MPGKLFVLVKQQPLAPWGLVAAAVNAAEAQPAVTAFLETAAGARVVVAQGIRSFQASVVQVEDAIVTVEP